MKDPSRKLRTPRQRPTAEGGFTLIETMVAVAMIMVVLVFALLRISEAQQALRLDNEIRQFKAYLEKARVDSIRRRAQTDAQMAKVTVSSPTTYTIQIDADGNGVLDPPRTIRLQPMGGLTFVGPLPLTIRYNWRGRTVDATGALTTVPTFTLKDSYHVGSTINLSGSGMSLDDNVNMSTVSSSSIPANANIQSQVKLP